MTRTLPTEPLVLYGLPLSGHCHRVALFLSLLRLPFRYEELDLAAGAHRQPDFLALNPFGQIPVLKDGDTVLADSNAILVYLAGRYGADEVIRWLPADPLGAAGVQRWFSAAASLLAFGPARARLKHVFGADIDYAAAVALADRLLPVMEQTLSARAYLAADAPTLADIAMYSYTAHAPEGGVSLRPYPAVRAWLQRVEALPGFVGMPRSPDRSGD